MRVVIYARFSSDQQRDASIDDQIRICRARADREGWTIGPIFTDHAISGSTVLRPGYQSLLAHLRSRLCDIVLAESLDRFSRDQEHIAAFFKQTTFAGSRIITLSEGEVSELHIGLKGTMGALYLKDLAAKTHRGLAGRILAGKGAGSISYGYRKVVKLDTNGEPERGLREIDESKADIVRRIFRNYADGLSPSSIARALNDEGVPGPTSGIWYDTTIRGRPKRNDGMLRNELYRGRLVWNRLHNTKDPTDGSRVRRMNPTIDLVECDVPALAIVDPVLWQKVQTRLAMEAAPLPNPASNKPGKFWDRRRPRYLLSRKVFCGVCGRGFSRLGKDYLGCAAARAHGCSNGVRLRQPRIEAVVLDALGRELMQPGPAQAFAEEFARLWGEKQAQTNKDAHHHERELKAVEKRIGHLIDALAEGIRSADIQTRLADLEQRRGELNSAYSLPSVAAPVIPADLSIVFQKKVADLKSALAGPEYTRALEAARGLIDQVIIRPPADPGDPPQIELIGDLLQMLKAGGFDPQPPEQETVETHLSDLFDSSVKGGLRALPPGPPPGPRPGPRKF